MRILTILACSALAACAGGAVTVPSDGVITEVPVAGNASTYGGGDFSTTVAGALDESGQPTQVALAGSTTGTGAALDQDRINLMQWTLEQQKIDAAIAERELASARDQLVVVQPGPLPNRVDGVNIALFAKQTSNSIGQSIYPRGAAARVTGVGNCGRFRDSDAAQRAFLAGGGPEQDRYGIDPDGDGFACKWDPAPYRALN
ncbi:hypothetical protein [Amaricoccus sp.]|uniref:hypothetical protein n=1 Tax=Amaricoccus sp. TaxID=1872485 RepID=UPI0026081161|nr:hypothetical protein [Amaricoccus sp.]HRO10206.1 hypothetical protein [Amaricoccus sp.]